MFTGSQTFNNFLSGNTFNRIFADTPTPNDPVLIDLSSGGEAEEYDSQNQGTRKRHHTLDVSNVAKRKAHENFLTESQKTRNRNMPLKKRGTGNREEELSFLNLLANENSNQAQNLVKIECVNDSTTCDSLSNVHPKRFTLETAKIENVCDCFNCFPVLGKKSSSTCKKLKKIEEASSSSSVIDASMIPGPSGLQPKKSITAPVIKRSFYESDSDDSDDHIELPEPQSTSILIEDDPNEVKRGITAPDLQLDWLTDSSPEEDDDVIFVSDRTAPIDLTADSDTDVPSPNDAVSIDRIQNGNAGESSQSVVSSPDPQSVSAAPSRNEHQQVFHFHNGVVHRVQPTTGNARRAPIMSSVATPSVSTPSITIASTPRVIINIPTPPLHTPAPRQTNFRNMITGNDVMLYDGQNYVPRFMRQSPSNPPDIDVAAGGDNANNLAFLRQRVQSQSPNQEQQHTHRRIYNPSATNYYRPPSPVFRNQTVPPPNPTENPAVPPTAHQNCRQHVGRCPFMTEGHHYNRPRRFSRDVYSMSNGRPPYAVHEDLWRRQYQEQEIRRNYWSPLFNENAPEVQVLRPPPANPYFGADPIGPYNHNRLVPTIIPGDNNNNTVTNSTDSLRTYDRLRNLQQPNAHTRYRRAAPW